MLGRRTLFLNLGLLALLAAATARPASGFAAAPQEPVHGNAPKAEAEPGHAPTPAASPAAHGAEAGHAAEAEEGSNNPLKPEPTLAIWTVLVFLGLLFILRRFAWAPLAEALHHREEHLEHTLLETEKARDESEKLLAEHRRLMAQADDRIRALFDKAQKDAQANADAIVRAAQAEAEAARDRAQREISTAKDQALSEIWNKTADAAVSVAGRVLSRSLNEDEHRRLLDEAIKELPALASSAANGRGGAHS
ncbi:ATP synthase subunit b precursor [Aquisphaera giovannonii]|uniref:ATP synthase subunit b n=1 Tax=Aquisphaera giovannonii TaxID=406548 RepID=A0A5B9W0I8_9BACT|nr:F0F1 ATP synthase subunit B [Aquisphaera giovannonii]QEH34078.1 ATP synthase subunit b precursor [Aquisphaera giovannonii]